MHENIIVNGEVIPADSLCISPFDRGLTLGHGLFETIYVNKGEVPLLEHHWERLVLSVKLLGLTLPFNASEFGAMIDQLIDANQLTRSQCGVRFTLTDGPSARGLLSDGKQAPTYLFASFSLPKNTAGSMSATLVTTRRNENSFASRVKSISYLDNILAKKEAVSSGFDEAFLLNSKLNLADGAISNVFMIKKGVVYTPFISDGALPGVIRTIILNHLIFDNLEIKEQSINKDMLFSAEEIFITNALLGVKPIHQFENITLQTPYPMTTIIAEALKKKFNYI